MENWVNGIPYEIAFWKGIYSSKKGRESLFRWSKYGKEIELAHFDVTQFLLQRENPVVVDAGCGMSFCNGDKLTGKQLNVCYIDPLAPFFNRIIKKKKLDLPNITFGFIEYLSAFIIGKASLVIVQNALDHSQNPLKGILECIESLEIGGVLYLQHHPNEAETENYRGFHQYNISLENNEMIVWNKEQKININTFVGDFAAIETSSCDGKVIAVITKKQEVPKELLDSKKDISDLCNQHIDVIQKFSQTSYSFSYHWDYLKFRIAQSFIQQLSWKRRVKIKKIMNSILSVVKNDK